MRREIAEWLEERDRELEHWLRLVASNAVSISATTQAIWTPAAHAASHGVTGSDWVTPESIGAATVNGHLIQDEGVNLTQRSTLDFQGAGVTAADSGGKTVVTIGGADPFEAIALGGGQAPRLARSARIPGHVVEDEGTPLTQRGTINFTGGGVTVTDSGGKTTVDVPTPATGADEGLMWALAHDY